MKLEKEIKRKLLNLIGLGSQPHTGEQSREEIDKTYEWLQKHLEQEIQTAVQKERTDLISYLKKMLSNKMNDIVFTNWKAPIYALIGYLEPTTKDTKDV